MKSSELKTENIIRVADKLCFVECVTDIGDCVFGQSIRDSTNSRYYISIKSLFFGK